VAVGGGADVYAGAARNKNAVDLSGWAECSYELLDCAWDEAAECMPGGICPFFKNATGDPVVLPLI